MARAARRATRTAGNQGWRWILGHRLLRRLAAVDRHRRARVQCRDRLATEDSLTAYAASLGRPVLDPHGHRRDGPSVARLAERDVADPGDLPPQPGTTRLPHRAGS